jgi:acetolactate synthase-1/2/3 large subunit
MEEFVNTTGIPFYTTPQGRGVVPEDHSRFFPGARSEAFREADVVLVVGTRANVLLTFLRPPRWNRNAKFIVVNLDPKEIGHNAPAEIGIVADAKAVFSQLTEAARGRFDPNARTPWIDELARKDASRSEQQAVQMNSDDVPIHPLRVCREVRDFIDRDAILVVDGHETLNFARQSIPTYVAGHRINAGTHGTMGVGVPFGIAAKVAEPDTQVVVLSGDGAFGWNGMEIDTAIRHDVPVLFVINNNGSYTAMEKDFVNPQKFLGYQRYDLMMQGLGGHGEWAERPEEIRPALERAYAAVQETHKPALVNIRVDPYAQSTTQMGMNLGH